MKKSTLALAIIAAMSVAPLAMADRGWGGSDFDVEVELEIEKEIDIEVDVETKGDVEVFGFIGIDSQSNGTNGTEQKSDENTANYENHDSESLFENQYMQNAQGNIGSNQASGDNNQQSNSASMAVADSNLVFDVDVESPRFGVDGNLNIDIMHGMADAENFVRQQAEDNESNYAGSTSTSLMNDQAFQNVKGNIGINQASGDLNAQSNNLALSLVNSASLSLANNSVKQEAEENYISRVGMESVESGNFERSAQIQLSGTYNGTSDQVGDVYLDVWEGDITHPTTGGAIGHVDLDDRAQGAQDPAGDGGALLFNEAGTMTLSGTSSGGGSWTRTTMVRSLSFARAGDQVLQNAKGNIGVNQASGSGNLQSNSLALSVAHGQGVDTGVHLSVGPHNP